MIIFESLILGHEVMAYNWVFLVTLCLDTFLLCSSALFANCAPLFNSVVKSNYNFASLIRDSFCVFVDHIWSGFSSTETLAEY